jgi:hypothetical protein
MATSLRHGSPGKPCNGNKSHLRQIDLQTPYEQVRDRRKKLLHNSIELVFQTSGAVLDERVRAGFCGDPLAAPQPLRSVSGKGRKGKALPVDTNHGIAVRRSARNMLHATPNPAPESKETRSTLRQKVLPPFLATLVEGPSLF